MFILLMSNSTQVLIPAIALPLAFPSLLYNKFTLTAKSNLVHLKQNHYYNHYLFNISAPNSVTVLGAKSVELYRVALLHHYLYY